MPSIVGEGGFLSRGITPQPANADQLEPPRKGKGDSKMKLQIQERGGEVVETTLDEARTDYPDIDTILMGDEDDCGWIVFNDGETQVRVLALDSLAVGEDRRDYVDADGCCVECGHPADNSSGHGNCDSPAHQ